MLLRTKKTQILLQRFPDRRKVFAPTVQNLLSPIGSFSHPDLQIIVKGPTFHPALHILLLTCDSF